LPQRAEHVLNWKPGAIGAQLSRVLVWSEVVQERKVGSYQTVHIIVGRHLGDEGEGMANEQTQFFSEKKTG
jgi:hypothetical protein